MGVEVFFTGLMLICFDGEANCPVTKSGWNTAWVLKADGPRRTCGWYSSEETRLELRFRLGEVESYKGYPPYAYCTEDEENGVPWVTCVLSERDICFIPSGLGVQDQNYFEASLVNLPRLDEIDKRFVQLDECLLRDSAPSRLNFPKGKIAAEPLWPRDEDPTRWYRSNGDTDEAFPRYLSDRLKVVYDTTYATVTSCSESPLKFVEVYPRDGARLTFRNFTKYPPTPDYDDEGAYESLAYFLWYYRLGKWDTRSGRCPDYIRANKDAVLLRCIAKKETGCVFDPSANADTRYWPPMLGPKSSRKFDQPCMSQ